MAYLLAHFELDDYDAWKSGRFDQDPAGRAQSGAKRHQLFRAVDDGNQVFIGLEFPSADEASAFRERLQSLHEELGLPKLALKTPPAPPSPKKSRKK